VQVAECIDDICNSLHSLALSVSACYRCQGRSNRAIIVITRRLYFCKVVVLDYAYNYASIRYWLDYRKTFLRKQRAVNISCCSTCVGWQFDASTWRWTYTWVYYIKYIIASVVTWRISRLRSFMPLKVSGAGNDYGRILYDN